MSVSQATTRLKEEGNGLFVQKKYQQAYEKYSAAISSMGHGGDKKFKAVLYGNRAACCLGLEK